MIERFRQKQIRFDKDKNKGRVKVSRLVALLEGHPYEDKIWKDFNIKGIESEYIVVGNIDQVCTVLEKIKKEYISFNLKCYTEDVFFSRGQEKIEGVPDQNPLIFNLNNFVNDDGEIVDKGLQAYAIYDSKSQFFETFSMAKYANMLFDKKLDALAELNLNFFRGLSAKSQFNKYQSYRMIENDGETFVRGITSLSYKEYGVDFSFVSTMLMLHKYMKSNPGNNYRIIFAALNESKLEIIVSSEGLKDAGDFGKISSAISIKTNDVGKGALSITHIINVVVKGGGFYLYPKDNKVKKKNISINHGSTSVSKAFEELSKLDDFYDYADVFVKELKEVKGIKTPDDLRKRILLRFAPTLSNLKPLEKQMSAIFGKVIGNEIKDFAFLLEMCKKAEELEIDYDLKDRVRIEISDILLNNK